MRVNLRGSLIIATLVALGAAIGPSLCADEASPHDLSQTKGRILCQICHESAPDAGGHNPSDGSQVGPPRADLDGVAICTQCHSDNVSHMVGISVDFPLPENLPLSEVDTVICMTCHKVHGPLRSDRPWSNVNFFDRLLDTEAMHKTYLLRINNEDGRLCLTCHDGEKG